MTQPGAANLLRQLTGLVILTQVGRARGASNTGLPTK